MPKRINLDLIKMTDEIILQHKQLAARLGTNRQYVRDMCKGGFRLPCQLSEAVNFLRENPHPTRFRYMNARPPSRHLSRRHRA